MARAPATPGADAKPRAAAIAHDQRFERGFVVTCNIAPHPELEARLGKHPAWSTIKLFYVQDYAKTTGRPLVAMLKTHGAKQTDTVMNKTDPGID